MDIRSAYSPAVRVPTHPEGKSRTKQSFKDETNINLILAKYEKGGVIDHINNNKGDYINLPSGLDFFTAQNIAINAQSAFDNLPGTVRAKFQNNAKAFLDFMENPENEKEAINLGLRESPASVQTEPVGQPAPVVEPVPNIEPEPE